MSRWKKTLARMLTDAKPISYEYQDAAAVLSGIDFELAPAGGGNHRKWRRRLASGTVVVIGLVEHGRGPMKAYLIRDMVQQIRDNGLIPEDLDDQ